MSLQPMAPPHGEWPRPAAPSLFDVLDAPDLDAPPYLSDPRPDLESDSAIWRRLLAAALALDGELPDGVFARLHCCRCLGGRLTKTAAGAYRIVPDETYLDGAEGWARDRAAFLAPVAAGIAGLLKGIGP